MIHIVMTKQCHYMNIHKCVFKQRSAIISEPCVKQLQIQRLMKHKISSKYPSLKLALSNEDEQIIILTSKPEVIHSHRKVLSRQRHAKTSLLHFNSSTQ